MVKPGECVPLPAGFRARTPTPAVTLRHNPTH